MPKLAPFDGPCRPQIGVHLMTGPQSRNSKNLTTIKCIPSSDIIGAKSAYTCLLNCRSVKNKALLVKDFIVHNDIDTIGITETWLASDESDKHVVNDSDKHIVKDLLPTGYKIKPVSRIGPAGGIALIFKESLDIKPQATDHFISFEHMECLLKSHGNWIRVVILYRPPPSAKNKSTFNMFWLNLPHFLKKLYWRLTSF